MFEVRLLEVSIGVNEVQLWDKYTGAFIGAGAVSKAVLSEQDIAEAQERILENWYGAV